MKAEHALLYICGVVVLVALIDLIFNVIFWKNDRRKK